MNAAYLGHFIDGTVRVMLGILMGYWLSQRPQVKLWRYKRNLRRVQRAWDNWNSKDVEQELRSADDVDSGRFKVTHEPAPITLPSIHHNNKP